MLSLKSGDSEKSTNDFSESPRLFKGTCHNWLSLFIKALLIEIVDFRSCVDGFRRLRAKPPLQELPLSTSMNEICKNQY